MSQLKQQAHDLPPPYPIALPASFSVGPRVTKPIVSIANVEAHLRILGAFDLIRQTVMQARQVDEKIDAAGAWAVFLARAVHRFERWVAGNAAPFLPVGRYIPPPDVLLVWHSYLLVSCGLLPTVCCVC